MKRSLKIIVILSLLLVVPAISLAGTYYTVLCLTTPDRKEAINFAEVMRDKYKRVTFVGAIKLATWLRTRSGAGLAESTGRR